MNTHNTTVRVSGKVFIPKDGDIVDFLAIEWNERHWEFDHPCVVLEPLIRYTPNGVSAEAMIDDMAIDLICELGNTDEDVSEEFNWRGWKLSTLRKVCRERIAGKDTWKTKIRSVIKQKIHFYIEDGDLTFKIIETINA